MKPSERKLPYHCVIPPTPTPTRHLKIYVAYIMCKNQFFPPDLKPHRLYQTSRLSIVSTCLSMQGRGGLASISSALCG